MARKLKTGETTNLGFIRALKERGTTAKPEFPASTLRYNLDSVSDKKITFLSPNETVVESVNEFSPEPPIPQDYTKLVLTAIDTITGEGLNFSATVTDQETGSVVAELTSGNILEAIIPKNKVYTLYISADGYMPLSTGLDTSSAEEQTNLTYRLEPVPFVPTFSINFVEESTGEAIEADKLVLFDETTQTVFGEYDNPGFGMSITVPAGHSVNVTVTKQGYKTYTSLVPTVSDNVSIIANLIRLADTYVVSANFVDSNTGEAATGLVAVVYDANTGEEETNYVGFSSFALDLASGKAHRIVISSDGRYQTTEITTPLLEDNYAFGTITLFPESAPLNIKIISENESPAAITLNGTDGSVVTNYGSGEMDFEVREGYEYIVIAKYLFYGDVEQTFTAQPGLVSINLPASQALELANVTVSCVDIESGDPIVPNHLLVYRNDIGVDLPLFDTIPDSDTTDYSLPMGKEYTVRCACAGRPTNSVSFTVTENPSEVTIQMEAASSAAVSFNIINSTTGEPMGTSQAYISYTDTGDTVYEGAYNSGDEINITNGSNISVEFNGEVEYGNWNHSQEFTIGNESRYSFTISVTPEIEYSIVNANINGAQEPYDFEVQLLVNWDGEGYTGYTGKKGGSHVQLKVYDDFGIDCKLKVFGPSIQEPVYTDPFTIERGNTYNFDLNVVSVAPGKTFTLSLVNNETGESIESIGEATVLYRLVGSEDSIGISSGKLFNETSYRAYEGYNIEVKPEVAEFKPETQTITYDEIEDGGFVTMRLGTYPDGEVHYLPLTLDLSGLGVDVSQYDNVVVSKQVGEDTWEPLATQNTNGRLLYGFIVGTNQYKLEYNFPGVTAATETLDFNVDNGTIYYDRQVELSIEDINKPQFENPHKKYIRVYNANSDSITGLESRMTLKIRNTESGASLNLTPTFENGYYVFSFDRDSAGGTFYNNAELHILKLDGSSDLYQTSFYDVNEYYLTEYNAGYHTVNVDENLSESINVDMSFDSDIRLDEESSYQSFIYHPDLGITGCNVNLEVLDPNIQTVLVAATGTGGETFQQVISAEGDSLRPMSFSAPFIVSSISVTVNSVQPQPVSVIINVTGVEGGVAVTGTIGDEVITEFPATITRQVDTVERLTVAADGYNTVEQDVEFDTDKEITIEMTQTVEPEPEEEPNE